VVDPPTIPGYTFGYLKKYVLKLIKVLGSCSCGKLRFSIHYL